VISNERLLEVAREVFLESGIRATTAEVAARAGIAEGTIFVRFKSKAELFRDAMRINPDEAMAFVEALPALAGTGDLRQHLLDFAVRLLSYGRLAMPVMMMSWSNPDGPLCGKPMPERAARYRRTLGALESFFTLEMEAGRIRKTDTEVLGRMLLGSLLHYCMIEVIAGEPIGRHGHLEFARHTVDTLLAAVRTEKG
jgi:AcrR family transcriptional regulator